MLPINNKQTYINVLLKLISRFEQHNAIFPLLYVLILDII